MLAGPELQEGRGGGNKLSVRRCAEQKRLSPGRSRQLVCRGSLKTSVPRVGDVLRTLPRDAESEKNAEDLGLQRFGDCGIAL